MKNHQKGLIITLVAALMLNSVLVLGQQPTRSQGEGKPKREARGDNQPEHKAKIETAKQQNKAQIEFAAPVLLDDALEIAARQNLTITQIQHSFMMGDQKFVGFYPVEAGASPETIAVDMIAKYREFLQDVSRERDEDASESPSPEPMVDKERRSMKAQAEEAFVSSYQSEFRVDVITVLGGQNQLDAVKEESPLISKIESSDDKEAPISIQAAPRADGEAQAASNVDENTWVPVSGKIITAPSAAGGRYVEQQMRWSNVSGFGANSTYEHDFFLKNSAGTVRGPGTYLDRSERRIDHIPIVEYATSNLPRAYLDSRLKDGNEEIAFTIGCAKASDIKVGETYTSYIRTKDGDASQDDGKLQAQLGHRTPSWCYDTLCSFDDEQVARVVIVPAWEVPVPGVKAWDRTRAPVAHFSMSAQGKSANDFETLNLSVPVNGNVTVAFRSTSAQGSWPITKYVWKSNGTQICSNSSTCNYNFGTASNTITLTVTDSSGKSLTASGLVKLSFVSSNPSVTRLSYSPNPAKAAKVVRLGIYGDRFASNAQVWFVGPGCSSSGCRTNAVNVASSTYIAAEAVLNNTGTYTVNIRNGSGAWVKAGTVKVVR